MDVPRAHPPGIKGNYFFLYARYIPLVFRDQFRLKFPITVSWHVNLEFPILAF